MGLGSNKEELLLFQLFTFLQKGGNDQSWCGLDQVILLFLQNTVLPSPRQQIYRCSGMLGAA